MNPIISAQETTKIIPSIDTSITSSQSNKVLPNLPPEILDIIFEKLAETGSLLDIFNLARSSKLFFELAKYSKNITIIKSLSSEYMNCISKSITKTTTISIPLENILTSTTNTLSTSLENIELNTTVTKSINFDNAFQQALSNEWVEAAQLLLMSQEVDPNDNNVLDSHAIVIGMLTLNPKLMDLLQNWRGADGQTINFEKHFKNLEKVFGEWKSNKVFGEWRSNTELADFLFRLKNLFHKLATNKKEDILEIYTPSIAAIKFLLPYVSSYLTANDRFEILLEAVKFAAKSTDTHFLRFLLDGSNCEDIFTPCTPYYGFAERGFEKLNNAALCENNLEVARLLIDWRGPNGEWTDIVTNQCEFLGHLQDHLSCRDTKRRKTCIKYIKLLLDWRGGPERKRVFTYDSLNYLILSATINMRDDKDCEELLEYLLRWRGPNEEFFDPRLHRGERSDFLFYREPLLLVASKCNNIKAFNLLLNWRGPKEECFDVNKQVKSILFEIASSGDGGLKFLQPLLDWRGPKGETLDLTSEVFFRYLEYCLSEYRKTPLQLFKHLLSWQDQNGRYFDPTLYCNHLLSAAVLGNHLEVIHLILNWKPPTNSQTRNSKSHFSFKEARNNIHKQCLPYQKEKENRAVSSFEDTSNMIENELLVKSDVKVDIASSCILL